MGSVILTLTRAHSNTMQPLSPVKLSVEFFRDGQRRQIDIVMATVLETRVLKEELLKHGQCFVTTLNVPVTPKRSIEEDARALAHSIIKDHAIPPITTNELVRPAVAIAGGASSGQAPPALSVKAPRKRSMVDDDEDVATDKEASAQQQPPPPLAKRLMKTAKEMPSPTEFLRKWRLRRPSTVNTACEACDNAATHWVWTVTPGAMIQSKKIFVCKEHALEQYKKKYGNAAVEFLVDREYEKIRAFEGGQVRSAVHGRSLEQFLDRVAVPSHLLSPDLCALCRDTARFTVDVKTWSLAEKMPVENATPMCIIHAKEYYREEKKKHDAAAAADVPAKKAAKKTAVGDAADVDAIAGLVKRYCDTKCRLATREEICQTFMCTKVATHQHTYVKWNRGAAQLDKFVHMKCWEDFKAEHIGELPTVIPKLCTFKECTAPAVWFGVRPVTDGLEGPLKFDFSCHWHSLAGDVELKSYE